MKKTRLIKKPSQKILNISFLFIIIIKIMNNPIKLLDKLKDFKDDERIYNIIVFVKTNNPLKKINLTFLL